MSSSQPQSQAVAHVDVPPVRLYTVWDAQSWWVVSHTCRGNSIFSGMKIYSVISGSVLSGQMVIGGAGGEFNITSKSIIGVG